jgi:hypothetical protein
LQNLAEIYICGLHKKHEPQAIAQWLKELNIRGNFESLRLEEDDTFESSDTHTEESEEHTDEIEELMCECYRAGRKPDQEGNPFEEEEGISVLSNQSMLPIRTVRRAMTMEEDAVAKNVTWLLKQPLDGKSSETRVYLCDMPSGLSWNIQNWIYLATSQAMSARQTQ